MKSNQEKDTVPVASCSLFFRLLLSYIFRLFTKERETFPFLVKSEK